MIDSNWLFITQLGSVLIYVGVAFILYRLLISQKDATIQSKDATIEKLKGTIQELEVEEPDVLLQRISERLNASYREIEVLQDEMGEQDEGMQSLIDGLAHMTEVARVLSIRAKIRDCLLDESYEDYKGFVIAVCGDSSEASRAIMVKTDVRELVLEEGKKLEIKKNFDSHEFAKFLDKSGIIASFSQSGAWLIEPNGRVVVDDKALKSFGEAQMKIRQTVGLINSK